MPGIKFDITGIQDQFVQSATKIQKSVDTVSSIYKSVEDKERLAKSVERYRERKTDGTDLEGFNTDARLLFESIEAHYQKCIDSLREMQLAVKESQKRFLIMENWKKKSLIKKIEQEISVFEMKKQDILAYKKDFS